MSTARTPAERRADIAGIAVGVGRPGGADRDAARRDRGEQFADARGADGAVVAAAQTHVVHDLPVEVSLVGADGADRAVVGEPVAKVGAELLDERQVLQDRNQDFAEQLVGVHRAASIAQHAVAQHVAGAVGLVELGVGGEGVLVAAVVGADGEADFTGRQFEGAALDAGFNRALFQGVLVQGATADVADAVARRGQVAERVEAARAIFRAARGAVQQTRDGGGAGPAELLVVELGAAERGVAVPGPVLEADVAREARGQLIDGVAVLLDPRTQDVERLIEGEAGVRVRARGQDVAEIGRNVRVRNRNRQAIDVRGQGRIADARRLIVGERELREHAQVVAQLVVDLAEHRVAVEVRLHRGAVVAEVDLLLGARSVRVDDVGLIGFRIAEVQNRDASRREQCLVGVEADLAGVLARRVAGQSARAVLAHEHVVDRSQRRQVGAEQYSPLRDSAEAWGRGAEDVVVAGALQSDVAIGVVDRDDGAALAFVETSAGGHGDLEGFAVALFRDAVLAV